MSYMYVGMDTFNAYRWDATIPDASNQWVSVLNASTVPAADAVPQVNPVPRGCEAIAGAPSNRSIVYTLWSDGIYKSTNAGDTWIKTLSGIDNAPNDDFRTWSSELSVKPDDPDVVLAGTRSGLYRTSDGGNNWTQITNVPTPPDMANTPRSAFGPGFTGMAWDPTNSNRVLVCSIQSGVWESTNAGATFSLMPGSPSAAGKGAAFGSDGTYYTIGHDDFTNGRSNDTSAWKHDGSWTQISNLTVLQDVAVDPNNSQRVILARASGQLLFSLNGGASFGAVRNATRNNPLGSLEPGWLEWTTENFFTTASIDFHPTIPNRLMVAQGLGVWYADIGTGDPGTSIQWQSMSRGIEQLVTNNVIWPTASQGGNGRPVVSVWDRGIFVSPSDTDYPQTHGPSSIFDNCWHIAADPFDQSRWVYSMGENGNGGSWTPEHSGYTTNNGATWNDFNSIPLNSTHIDNTFGAGCMAVSNGTIIWLSTRNKGMYRSVDNGNTWSQVGANATNLFAQRYFIKRDVLTADQVTPGTFYAASSDGSGCWKSTDDGLTWFNSGSIPNSSFAQFHSKMKAVPGNAGHLYYCVGRETGITSGKPLSRSVNGGATFTSLNSTDTIWAFGFGAPDAVNGATYPTIWAIGFFGGAYGLHYSTDEGLSWTFVEKFPNNSLDTPVSLAGDMSTFGRCVVALNGSGVVLVDLAGV